MSSSVAGVLQLLLLVAALAVCYKPLGNYLAYIFTSRKHLKPERAVYRLMGIDPEADQRDEELHDERHLGERRQQQDQQQRGHDRDRCDE